MVGIYKITNLISGKCYIGQSRHVERRFNAHKNKPFDLNSESYDYPLYRAIRKYGLENFKFEVIEECSVDKLNELERKYIKVFDSFLNGYNQDEGGNNASHFLKLSFDDLMAIIERLRTSKDSSEIIGKEFGVSGRMIRDINTGAAFHRDNIEYPIRAKLPSKPHKKKRESGWVPKKESNLATHCLICGKEIGYTKTGHCVECAHKNQRRATRPSPLDLAKMIIESSFSAVGRQFDVDGNTIKKWCKQYGIPHKVEELTDWYYKEIGAPRPKTIVEEKPKQEKRLVQQINPDTEDVINTFESTRMAAKSIGVTTNSHIIEVCNGKLEMAYGYKWRYISESEYNK